MADPTTAIAAALNNAKTVANTPLFTTVIDKLLGFRISEWAAEAEVRKKLIHDEYERAKKNGILGLQYISTLRETTNLIDVAVKATKYIKSKKANKIEMNNDFFWNLIEHSKVVSDEEVQELIAKIIASEYETPRTYSMSTLQIIKLLGREELRLFEKVCSLLINNFAIPRILFSGCKHVRPLMIKLDVHFGQFQLLQSLGLFLPNNMSRTTDNLDKSDCIIKYFDKLLIFESVNNSYDEIREPNFYALSKVGIDILKHLNPKFYEDYYLWLKENYEIPNYKFKKEV